MTITLSHYSAQQKKDARDLTVTDLIHSLKKLKSGQSLRLGDLGTFTKTQQKIKITSRLFKQATGKTYLYYRVNFRASQHLKRELDN